MVSQREKQQNFGDRLKAIRGHRSQTEFAQLIGLASQQAYATYQQGRIPKLPVLRKICDLSGVDMNWLLEGTQDGPSHPVDNVEEDLHPAFHTPLRRPQRDTASAHLYEACAALLTTMSLAADTKGLDSQYHALQAMLSTYHQARKSEVA